MTRDHLARLCFEGAGSGGLYTPHAFQLRLLGVAQPTDHIVYLHEVHHAALNDMTAWGSALHVYARLPGGPAPQFGPLLDACRVTHESLATFASVQIAIARHGPLDEVLAAYPQYVPLYETTMRLTAGVEGPSRRQQLATALARLCMQTPVLETILTVGLDAFRLAAIRERDRPDARWEWFQRRGPGLFAAAAAAADRTVLDEYGPTALHSDAPTGDLYTSTDRSHDATWDRWEAVAYQRLRAALSDAGARTLPLNGHQTGTAATLALVHAQHGPVGLRAEMTEDKRRDDAQLASSILQQVRHDLAGDDCYRAVLVPPMRPGELVDLLADRPVIEGRPAMIVDARPPARLAALYRWPSGELPAALRSSPEPVVAVRLMVDDANDDTAATIGHAVLDSPAGLAELAAAWGDRGAFVLCVSASSLTDPGFARRWLSATGPNRPIFILVDVEPERFVRTWARESRPVVAIAVDVTDTGGLRTALLLTADDGQVWWLVVADDVTVRLVIEYLRGQVGTQLRFDSDRFTAIREPALVAITHVLATESFTSFNALVAPHAD